MSEATTYPSVAGIDKRLSEINEEAKLLRRQRKISEIYEAGQRSVKTAGAAKPPEQPAHASEAEAAGVA